VLFQLTYISGDFPACLNTRPVAERGANARPGDAAERRENASPGAPLRGGCATGTAADGILPPHAKAINSTLGILLNVCAIPRFMRRCPSDVQVNQAANGVITSCNALAEMLESMEHLVRLRIYAETSHAMPAVDAIVVKLMVELISALVTRKLKKRRSRESFFANMLLHSARRSQMGKDFFRGQGYQQRTSEAWPSPTRGSGCRSSDSQGCRGWVNASACNPPCIE